MVGFRLFLFFFLFLLTSFQLIAADIYLCRLNAMKGAVDEFVGSVYRGKIPVGNKHFFVKTTKNDVHHFGAPGRISGHASSKHKINIKDPRVLDILNSPDRIFTGKNSKGNFVDIYYKDGSVVITDSGKKTEIITVFGKVEGAKKIKGRMRQPHNPKVDQWLDPHYVRSVDGVEQEVGWNQFVSERYAEIPINDPTRRINNTEYPLFQLE